MTEPRDWPPEQSAHGALRPWHATATGYLAVLFEDSQEAQRAQRGLQQHGVPEGDLRLYDGEETLGIASRLEQERSALAKAINEVVVDRALRERWLANARAGGSLLWIYAPSKDRATRLVGLLATTATGRCATSARAAWKTSKVPPADWPALYDRGQQRSAWAARPSASTPLTCGAIAAAGAASQATTATA